MGCMRILISADMEGISGIVDWAQVMPGSADYESGRALMAGDVNAAINGAFTAGAEVVSVADGHYQGRNLELAALDPRARLQSGSPSPFSMLNGIDDEPRYDAVVLVGYHAMAGAKKAVLAHTWSDLAIAGVWVNGVALGEIGLNALTAGYFRTPVIAVTGDRLACLEAQMLLGSALEVCVVKMGTGRYAADLMPLPEARDKICETVARAVAKLKMGAAPAPYALPAPLKLEVEFKTPEQVDAAFLIPGTQRLSGTRLSFVADDMVVVMRAFRAMASLAGSVHRR